MSIKYVLHPNHLTEDPDAYAARVAPDKTVDMEGVIDAMMDRGSTVVRADVYSVLEDFCSVIETLVLDGKNVCTPSANYRAGVRGNFHGPEDSFDASRHQVMARVTPGRRLRKAIADRARLVKELAIEAQPRLLAFVDVASGVRNDALTAGSVGQLVGHNLQVDAGDPAQGIFFLAEDGSATQVSVLARNMPKEQIFLIPDLAPGVYTLEVRAVLYGGTELRSGRLKEPLTVS